MSTPTSTTHDRLVEALRAAHRAGRGIPTDLEPIVRSYAAARRVAGDPVERILVDVKLLLAQHVGGDVDLFKHRVVGWTVAGFFAGTTKSEAEGAGGGGVGP